MNPILAFAVAQTPLERVRRQHQQKVLGLLDALQQIVVELPRLQPLDVDEDAKPSQLQVHLEQAGELRSVRSPVTDEDVERLVQIVVVEAGQAVLERPYRVHYPQPVDRVDDSALALQLILGEVAEGLFRFDAGVQHAVGVGAELRAHALQEAVDVCAVARTVVRHLLQVLKLAGESAEQILFSTQTCFLVSSVTLAC